jgi:hypothetical protein
MLPCQGRGWLFQQVYLFFEFFDLVGECLLLAQYQPQKVMESLDYPQGDSAE